MKFDPKRFLDIARRQGLELRVVGSKIHILIPDSYPDSIWLQTIKKHRRSIMTSLREEIEKPLTLDLFDDL